MFPNSNFDDWKWATEQSCIHNEITSYKIPTLEEEAKIDKQAVHVRPTFFLVKFNRYCTQNCI